MKTLDERIAQLDAMLDAGVTTFTVDGETQTIDLAQVRKRRDELVAQKAAQTRPTLVALNLGSAW